MDITATLASELSIQPSQVQATLGLLEQGDTIPFIARYRKEVTGNLDDATLRAFAERLESLKNLEERRKTILDAIREQGQLTPELETQLNACDKVSQLENLYRPYKKKRKTRASMAVEEGLAPLAAIVLAQKVSEEGLQKEAERFVNPEKGVDSTEKALAGASDILAEKASDVPHYYDLAKEYLYKSGRLESKETKDDALKKYASYANFSMPVRAIKNYQTLALNRGEKEKGLSVSFAYDHYTLINQIARDLLIPHSPLEERIRGICKDSYDRLIAPSVENEVRGELFEKAEDAAIVLFKDNLRQLLLTSPVKGQRVMGFDPAFVNGCKLADVDENGTLLSVDVVYPTIAGAARLAESERIVLKHLLDDKITTIALGNGTASRESEAFLTKLLNDHHLPIRLVIVNEAGASVYSASELASQEFPQLSVEKRSAISLAHRLQDALSELVKITPESLGVGQYQHDLDAKKLSGALEGVVEDCVNEVGVALNNASPSLLSYVSGIGPALAKNIVAYRESNGAFQTRRDLLNVPKLGAKAYEQCAGFLRIPFGKNPLDNTAVHPESYPAAKALLASLGLAPTDLGSERAKTALQNVTPAAALASQLGIGLATLQDIVAELKAPGRDIRESAASPVLSSQAKDIKDLKVGMILSGTVRNIVDFGAFVDIGVHQDGLIHISELSATPISSPLEVVHINEIVTVKVLSVDLARGRIGLSLKQAKA